jgi:hypothetical protein
MERPALGTGLDVKSIKSDRGAGDVEVKILIDWVFRMIPEESHVEKVPLSTLKRALRKTEEERACLFINRGVA